ncbi:hypothetical protein ALC56_05714 [Trachymyrmex septentrionalis]|uniref:Osiris 6 n=1 Tax=Trachymyrmex septentrionalis TaxID=34720 RepID=A0A195FHW0_9HYME|nr:PREDICTED: uncharacterized protein LOC108748090 [Trachymyrmex septentrionalis]KYN39946.1 hypothetical protein ALC56_05714 [Trachymyrmex septentrionalis]
MKLLKQFIILITAVVFTTGQSIDECLKQDSISCVQKTLYRTAKEFFAKDKLELINGISLVKSNVNARSSKELTYDQEMEAADNIVERQNSLENFVSDEAGQFLTGRNLRINLASAFEKIQESARAFSESTPPEIRQAVNEIVEARGKKKGMLKGILPLLVAAKIKFGLLGVLLYFVTGFLAKKAIQVSIISLLISAFIGLRTFWSGKNYHHDVTPYNGGWSGGFSSPVSGGWSSPVNSGWSNSVSGGWSNGGSSGWEDSNYAHNQAYGYHH